MFNEGQIFIDEYPKEAVAWCNKNGMYHISEIEPENGHRRFNISKNKQMSQAEIAKLTEESQRLPNVEDATIDLAAYIAELEGRIAQLEAKNG